MAARRNKRGRQRNRGRFGFLYKLLSAVLILAAIIVGCVVFFRVDEIEVTGNVRYTQEQLVQAAEVERGDNLFTLNKFQMSRQILTRLPYVDEVNIYRRLPDTLVINVTECAPIAAIQADGAWWVLDQRTKLLERTDFATGAGYPEVTGLTAVAPTVGVKLAVAEEEQFKLDSLRRLFEALEAHGAAAGCESFDLTAGNVILMKYGGRFTVKMPMSTDFNKVVTTILAAVETLPETDTGVLDLTLKDAHLIPYSN